MKSAVCDDDDHELCTGKFYKYETHPERRLRSRVRVHAITRKKEDSLTFACDCGYRREKSL
jgi:hypothetical protein